MIHTQKSKFFDCPTMETWRKKPANQKTFANACTFYEEIVKDLKHYKRTTGETKGSMDLQGANAAT